MDNKTQDATHPSHYSQFKIEPLEYIMENNLDFLQGNVVKYVSRFRQKNGIEDLEKAKFYINKLIEQEKNKCKN